MDEAKKVDDGEQHLVPKIAKLQLPKKKQVENATAYGPRKRRNRYRPSKQVRQRLKAAEEQLRGKFPDEKDFRRELQKYKNDEIARLDKCKVEQEASRLSKIQSRNEEMEISDIFDSLAIGGSIMHQRQCQKQREYRHEQRKELHRKKRWSCDAAVTTSGSVVKSLAANDDALAPDNDMMEM